MALQTVEAEVDVNGNVRLLEPLRVTKPTRALLTLLEDAGEPAETQGNAAVLFEFLRNNRLPESARPTVEEIEAQIEEIVRSMQSNPIPADAPRFAREELHERRWRECPTRSGD